MKAYCALADYYDKLMDDVDYDKWAQYLSELIGRQNARIYEAACGTGNISYRLQRLGHVVTASDSSSDMLRVASKKARDEGLPVTFVRQDMRHISVGNKVHAVVCACDGPNYLNMDGLRGFAATAYAALNPGGLLLFDISTRAKLGAMDGQVYYDERDDMTCIWQNTFDDASHMLTMELTLFVREGSLFAKHTETHVQHAHDVQDMSRVIQEAGFSQVQVFECLSNRPCDDTTQRAQFVCSKTI